MRVMRLDAPIVERESPDFEIALGERTVGIEVTELYQPTRAGESSLQAIASVSREIVERAERRHRASDGRSLRVSVAFSRSPDLLKVRREDAADLLLELVERLLQQPGDVVEWRPTYRNDLKFAERFSHVHIYRHPPEFEPHWLVVAAGWVAPLTANLIQSRIDEKSGRVASYLEALSEVWLIVGVRGDGPSQFFEFDTEGLEEPVTSPFHRTYFLDAFSGRVVELRTTRDA